MPSKSKKLCSRDDSWKYGPCATPSDDFDDDGENNRFEYDEEWNEFDTWNGEVWDPTYNSDYFDVDEVDEYGDEDDEDEDLYDSSIDYKEEHKE